MQAPAALRQLLRTTFLDLPYPSDKVIALQECRECQMIRAALFSYRERQVILEVVRFLVGHDRFSVFKN
jgi:hypothetical protein